jgi:hypothetical protein
MQWANLFWEDRIARADRLGGAIFILWLEMCWGNGGIVERCCHYVGIPNFFVRACWEEDQIAMYVLAQIYQKSAVDSPGQW